MVEELSGTTIWTPESVAEDPAAGAAAPRQIFVLTGMSGAGKSSALRIFEDLGYFCVDNLPLPLIDKFLELAFQAGSAIQGVALGIDIRGREFFQDAIRVIRELREAGYDVRVLFLDAQEDVLVRRFKEARRPHPLAPDRSLPEAIQMERELLQELRAEAALTIDTTEKTLAGLRGEILPLLRPDQPTIPLVVRLVSFGFKGGIPRDADLVFDVRTLPNPHYNEELRPFTGADDAVQEYVMRDPVAQEYLRHLTEFITFLMPQFIAEGRFSLTVAIGCTGGRHRAPTMTRMLQQALTRIGAQTVLMDRDLTKEDERYRQ